jgi:hypothetical protein
MILTFEQVRNIINYDPVSGVAKWNTKLYRGKHSAGDVINNVHHNNKISYYRVQVCGVRYMLHKLIVLYMTGEYPTSKVDHIDGDGLNNKWDNLRHVTNAENGRNCSINSNNTSGHLGVSKFRNGWRVRVKFNGIEKHIGVFQDFDQAVKASRQAYTNLGFHANHGRPKK